MSEIRSQATPAYKAVANRRAATHALHHDLLDGGPKIDAKFSDIHHMAGNAIRHGWSKPRTVNSATELDALPLGSVVWTQALVGPVGHIFVKCAGMWIIPWHDTAEDPLEQNGSVTVLFTPGEAV